MNSSTNMKLSMQIANMLQWIEQRGLENAMTRTHAITIRLRWFGWQKRWLLYWYRFLEAQWCTRRSHDNTDHCGSRKVAASATFTAW